MAIPEWVFPEGEMLSLFKLHNYLGTLCILTFVMYTGLFIVSVLGISIPDVMFLYPCVDQWLTCRECDRQHYLGPNLPTRSGTLGFHVP